jgi:hypothetical protein
MGRLQNDPSIGWVRPKSTHGLPLAWDNKYIIFLFQLLSQYETYHNLTQNTPQSPHYKEIQMNSSVLRV